MTNLSMNKFIEVIKYLGGRCYFVGGSVRDELIGKIPHDIDITITGVSRGSLEESFPNMKHIGSKFPVYRMMVDGDVVDISLARRDIKVSTGHRGFEYIASPDITIEEDLYRRDITINAMARDVVSSELIDPFKGIDDINKKTIRAVSCHFSEDPLRALRAARIATVLNYAISYDTVLLMDHCKDEICDLSHYRRSDELEKAICADRPSRYFRELEKAGILKVSYRSLGEHIDEKTMYLLDRTASENEDIAMRYVSLIFGSHLASIDHKHEDDNGFYDDISIDLISLIPPKYRMKCEKILRYIMDIAKS